MPEFHQTEAKASKFDVIEDISGLFDINIFLPEASFALQYCCCLRLCVCVCVYQSLACLCNNSGPIKARIAKFGPLVYKTLLKVLIVLRGDRP